MSLADEILQGNVRAAARLMRDVEDGAPSAPEELKKLYPFTGNAHIIGVTGAPGVGKSTVVDKMVEFLRKDSKDVGVIAIDPTSPFGGGALLGDRIRMQRHTADPGVFMRSFATRGHLGGLSRATYDTVKVMEALGKDVILIETVGVGQDEVDILHAADTCIVILVPGLGDHIQTMKGGLLEIADIYVINKSSRNGADELAADLTFMLEMGTQRSSRWIPPICRTEASTGEGVTGVMDAVQRHWGLIQEAGLREQRERQRARTDFLEILNSSLIREAMHRLGQRTVDRIVETIVAREHDPYSAAEDVIRNFFKKAR